MLTSLLMLSMALSIDSFGVGITYGIRNTKISFLPKLILFIISFSITLASLSIGSFILTFLPASFTVILGSALLGIMGSFIIWQSMKPEKKEPSSPLKTPKRIQFFVKSLGLTIQIIQDPANSDLDGSMTIDCKEAIYLGFAMSADSLCSGIGVSMLGVQSFLFPLLVAGFQLIFLCLGGMFGKKIKSISTISPAIWTRISGILLILIAIGKIWIN